MLDLLNTISQYIGYFVLGTIGLSAATTLWFKYRVRSNVSPEAKELAAKVDPNNPVEGAMAEVVMDDLLEEVRDLQRNETIQSNPAPITYFDWSVDNATQEDIEHILGVLQEAGYHTHALPDIDNYRDNTRWSRERAGIWRSEPDWHIVAFDDDGSRELKEAVDLDLPESWKPEVTD